MDRVVYRVELSAKGAEAIRRYTDDLGMTQIAFSTRLIEWLARQPASVREAILSEKPLTESQNQQIVRQIVRSQSKRKK
jgi:hypothetical protein